MTQLNRITKVHLVQGTEEFRQRDVIHWEG